MTDEDRKLIIALINERREHLRIAASLTNRNIAEKFDLEPKEVTEIARGLQCD